MDRLREIVGFAGDTARGPDPEDVVDADGEAERIVVAAQEADLDIGVEDRAHDVAARFPQFRDVAAGEADSVILALEIDDPDRLEPREGLGRGADLGAFAAQLLRPGGPGDDDVEVEQVGVVPGEAEPAEAGLDAAVGEVDVDPTRPDRGNVLEEALDLGESATNPRDESAGRRIGGQETVENRRRTGDGLDRAFQPDPVPVRLERETGEPGRAVDAAGDPAFRGFREKRLVAAGTHRDLGIGLLIGAVGGNAGGDAGGAHLGVVGEAPRREIATMGRAGIVEDLVEARLGAEQLADRWCPEPFGIRSAKAKVRDRLPVDAAAERRRRAGRRIIGEADGAAQFEKLDERQIGKDRRVQLGIGFLDVVAAPGRLGRDVGAEARGDDRIGIEAAVEVAIFDADGEPKGSAGKIEQIAREVGGQVELVLLRAVILLEGDEIDHRGGDRSEAAEQVERNAGRGAARDRAERLAEKRGIDVAEHRLFGLVAAVGGVDVPVPAAFAHVEIAVERRDPVIGVDRLVESARAALQEAAEDGVDIPVGAAEIDPEWIERIGRADDDIAEDRSQTGSRPDPERKRGRLVPRLAPVEQGSKREIDAFGQLVAKITEDAHPLERDLEIVERAEIEAVGGADEGPEVRGRRRTPDDRGDQSRVAADEGGAEVATIRRKARAGRLAGGGIRLREKRQAASAGADRVLADIIAADDELERSVRAIAPADLVILGEAVAAVVNAELGRGLDPGLAALGDDVDDPGDRVGAVNGRGAVLEDLDPLDRAFRNRVEIGRAGDSARRGAEHVAKAIDQDEDAARAEVAKIDLGGAGADSAAVGRIAEIAAIVELGVEAAARAGQALEDVVDRVEAGPGHVLLVDEGDRSVEIERIAADPGAGDDDRLFPVDDIALGIGPDRLVGDWGLALGWSGGHRCEQGHGRATRSQIPTVDLHASLPEKMPSRRNETKKNAGEEKSAHGPNLFGGHCCKNVTILAGAPRPGCPEDRRRRADGAYLGHAEAWRRGGAEGFKAGSGCSETLLLEALPLDGGG